MRFTRIVPLLPLASALVITDAEVFQNIDKSERSVLDKAQNVLDGAFDKVHDAYDGAFDKVHDVYDNVKDEAKNIYSKIHDAGCDVDAWLQGSFYDDVVDFEEGHDHPHHPPPHHDKPHHPPPPNHDKPHHGKPHHPPHDGDDKPNRTVYEVRININILISY